MNACTGAFSALMIILRSTGPVISTRRSSRSFGTGETRQLPARTASVARRKSGSAPSSNAESQARLYSREPSGPKLEVLGPKLERSEEVLTPLARVEARLALGVHTPEAYAVSPRI